MGDAVIGVLTLTGIVGGFLFLYTLFREAVKWARRPDYVRATGWSWWEWMNRVTDADEGYREFHDQLRRDYYSRRNDETTD